jgi:hypothetical protein
MTTSVPSPGGWIQLYGVRVAKALLLGTAGGAIVFSLFGSFNQGQVDHYCEGALVTKTGAKIVTLSCRNPFPNSTGAILAGYDQGIYWDTNTTVAGTLDAGIASTATASGQTVFNNVQLTGAPRFLSTAATGSTIRTSGLVRIGSGQYLNFMFVTTSCATLTGKSPGFVRMKWFNCSDVAGDVDC